MDKFTVTTGNKDTVELNRRTRAIALHDIWNRQYHNTVSSMFQKYKSLDDWSQGELMKVALLWTEKNGLLIDNQNGEIAKVSNKPSFMQIVK